MNEPAKLTKGAPIIPPPKSRPSETPPAQWRGFAVALVILLLGFGMPAVELAWFALGSKLYSYILLVPFISLYLMRLNRRQVPPASPPARKTGAAFLFAGGLVLAVYWLALRPRWKLLEDDYLALMTGSFLLFFSGICCWFWGREVLRAMAFPLAFLVFLVPIPAVALARIDDFLQHGSAVVVQGLFKMTGMQFSRHGLVFQLSDISLKIAPECSGIHSTLVLFITSLLAGYLLLRSPWKRALLVLVVVPLALLRNGFRVFVLGELCVHIGPQMIDSPIHHKGGPIFFILSLIPLFLLLMLLQRSERASKQSKPMETDHA